LRFQSYKTILIEHNYKSGKSNGDWEESPMTYLVVNFDSMFNI